MRFKVNNKYVIDAKSHDDAIRVVKMLDAMETYSIRWIDTYAKSQGYGSDFWRYDAEIKANNVKEALEKLAKHVALGGTGTANCLVMHVSNSHATYQFTGRLSELLKKTKEQLGDSVKDGRIAEIMKAKVKKKFEEEKDPTDKSAKITEDGYAFEIIRANGKKVIYRADSGFVNDAEPDTMKFFNETLNFDRTTRCDWCGKTAKTAITHYGTSHYNRLICKECANAILHEHTHDAEPETHVDLDFLIKDELEAIDGYRKMIAKTSNPQLLSVLSHILDEETEHVEELRAAQAGVYEVEDD